MDVQNRWEMQPMATWKLFLLVLPAFLVIDLVWLGLVMPAFYSQEMGDLARRKGDSLAPRWSAAALVYIIIPLGLVIFTRPYVGPEATIGQAFLWGAIYGLITYGIYDLTNLAVLEKWTVKLTVADMTWGAVLCGTTGVIMWFIDRAWGS